MTNSIPASNLVNSIPSVLSAGGNPLSLNAVLLSESARIPIGTVPSFPDADAVGNYFGFDSIEYTLASVYFAGFSTATALPGSLYFAPYNVSAVGAFLRSGSFSGVALTTLQGYSGTLIVHIDGRIVTSANINLASATSFTNAAALIQAGLQTAGGIFTGTGTIDDGAGGSGTVLTISAVTSGAVHVGDTVTGGSLPTVVLAQVSGTPGGIGVYTVSVAQDFNPGGTLRVTSAATVSYDSQLVEFLIHSATTGVDSTIGFATSSLATNLKFTSATGAVLSQGAAAAVPATLMASIVAVTQNWATFMTTVELATDVMMAFATWVQTTNKRYAYAGWYSDVSPLSGPAPDSFPGLVTAAVMSGVIPIYEPADDNGNGRKAALICAIAASTDYEATGGSLAYAYKGQEGLVADITNATQAANLIANNSNFYGAYATANDRFVMLQRGVMPGPYKFINQYIDQIWLNNALQLAWMELLVTIKKLPYNTTGYNLLRTAGLDPISAALNNGVIQPGVTLSNAQRAEINTAAGLNVADTVQTAGWYLQIKDASPIVRAAGGSPPITLWYTSGGAILNLDFASINVQ